MRWNEDQQSSDIEDRRDSPGVGGGGGGGFGITSRLGIGGVLVLLVLSFVFRRNLFALLDGTEGAPESPNVPGAPAAPHAPAHESASEAHDRKLVSFVLDDVQRTWDRELPKNGTAYRHAKLV